MSYNRDEQEYEIISRGISDSRQIARLIASGMSGSNILALSGDLGSGKSFICRCIIQSLCGEDLTVTSPTFNLVQTYEFSDQGACNIIYHFDLYRLEHVDEIYNLGIEEALSGGICLIEWPEIARHILPKNHLYLEIEILDEDRRKIRTNCDAVREMIS